MDPILTEQMLPVGWSIVSLNENKNEHAAEKPSAAKCQHHQAGGVGSSTHNPRDFQNQQNCHMAFYSKLHISLETYKAFLPKTLFSNQSVCACTAVKMLVSWRWKRSLGERWRSKKERGTLCRGVLLGGGWIAWGQVEEIIRQLEKIIIK